MCVFIQMTLICCYFFCGNIKITTQKGHHHQIKNLDNIMGSFILIWHLNNKRAISN